MTSDIRKIISEVEKVLLQNNDFRLGNIHFSGLKNLKNFNRNYFQTRAKILNQFVATLKLLKIILNKLTWF